MNLFKDDSGSPVPSSVIPGRESDSPDREETVTGEVKRSATEKAADILTASIAETERKANEQIMALAGNMESFDWKKVKPDVMAKILVKIPYRQKKDEPSYYLTPVQALIFAMEAYRMGLSPLSNQCFFNRDNNKVNATLEGKKAMARDQGYNFGPPKFTELARPWPKGKESIGKVFGLEKDTGFTCTMAIKGFEDRAEYTAWLSEWYVSYSTVWKEKPIHMLQVRAQEKCISSASGVGASEMPSEGDLVPPVAELPEIKVSGGKNGE